LFYRIGLSPLNSHATVAAGHHSNMQTDAGQTRKARFDGISSEHASVYIKVKDGEISSLTDEFMAVSLAKQFFATNNMEIKKTELVTHFSPEYDFRNKRLPVWKIETSIPEGHRIFVDPGTGIIVDYLVPSARWENLSFSFLHKWDFLVPAVGREVRDTIVVAVLIGLLGLALLGASIGRARNIETLKSSARKIWN
jgi:hypothetical protein